MPDSDPAIGTAFAVNEEIAGWGKILAPLATPLRPAWLLWDAATEDAALVRWAPAAAERELNAWRGLSSPHCARLEDVRAHQGGWLYRCEYVAGPHLGHHLGSRMAGSTSARALHLARQLFSACQALHQAGSAHGNLHPGNCLLAVGERLKIVDPGAELNWSPLFLMPEWRQQSLARERMLTLAPERFAPLGQGTVTATPAADIYAATAILFEMLARHPLHHGDSWEAMALWHERHAAPNVTIDSPALRELLTSGLHPDPASRLSAAEALRLLASAGVEEAEAEPEQAHILLERAARLRSLGRMELALSAVEQVARQFPNLALPQQLRVGILRQAQRWDEALAATADWLPLATAPAEGYVQRALIEQRRERNHSAIEALEQAIALDPNMEAAWFRLAVLFEDLGRNEQAIEYYNHLLHLNPAHGGAWSNKAGLLHALGRNNEALDAMNHAIELDPDNPVLCLNKGALMLQVWNDRERALPWLQKALAGGLEQAAELIEACGQTGAHAPVRPN